MTEPEWLACDDPALMIRHLRSGEWWRKFLPRSMDPRRPSARRMRLLFCAFERLAWMPAAPTLPDERGQQLRRILETAERYADGEVTAHELRACRVAMEGFSFAVCDDEETRSLGWWEDAVNLFRGTPQLRGPVLGPQWLEVIAGMCSVLRCLFHPFHPGRRVTPLTPTISAVAQAAYEQRCPGKGWLDPAWLTVLADALEDAGCTNADVLSHLRSPGPHVRGCWVVDAILAKA